jgi:hypothetical protein
MGLEAMEMAITPELVELLTDAEIDGALSRLSAKRAMVPRDDALALANLDEEITMLKTERAWREHLRRKYARKDASD